MLDWKIEYQSQYFKKIEKFYNHLTDSERQKLLYLRNKAVLGKLEHQDFNELKELADSMNYKRLK